MDKIIIYCENTQQNYTVDPGMRIMDFFEMVYKHKEKPNVMGVLANNHLYDMQHILMEAQKINFIDINSLDGHSIYTRTLIFILHKAIRCLFPKLDINAEHYISGGIFCKVNNKNFLYTEENIAMIRNKMADIIKADWSIVRKEVPTDYAIKLFKRHKLNDKINLLLTRGKLYTSIYYINNEPGYFYGTLAPRTSSIKVFDLKKYKDGILLMLPCYNDTTRLCDSRDEEKLFHIFSEHKRWNKIMHVSNIGEINHLVDIKEATSMIKISEALQEKKICQIADVIKSRRNKIKIILIAGPSSSGKTTFSKRLGIQLMVNGIVPMTLSLDDYFVEREKTPKDANGEYDFETIDALDLECFSNDMKKIINGEEVETPKFSFQTGKRFYDGHKIKMTKKNVLIIEGIHGLNPRLTNLLPSENIFKIFVSALTSISIDNHNIINPTDNRLLRRMVRDSNFRGTKAIDTLNRWQSVLDGELKYIVPYQEEADAVFNSALIYELSVLKPYAEAQLREVSEIRPEYSKALKLLKFLSYIKPLGIEEIPPTSLLREFVGGSSFRY